MDLHIKSDSLMKQKFSKNIFALDLIFINSTCLQPAYHLHRGLNSNREKGYERELRVYILIRKYGIV